MHFYSYVDLLVLSECLENDPSDIQVNIKLVQHLILLNYGIK